MPSVGDAYADPFTDRFFVYIGITDGWVQTDKYGNLISPENQERDEIHAKFPQLAKLWEEYQLMKKLCVGDNPRKDNAKR